MGQQEQPLILGNAEDPLTVGAFMEWRKKEMVPHLDKEDEQTQTIADIWRLITGNGDPKEGMSYKVGEMWRVLQRVDTLLSFWRWMWIAILGVLGATASIAVIGHNIGWW